MPVKNSVKQYDSPAYYYVYNREAGGSEIFCDDQAAGWRVAYCWHVEEHGFSEVNRLHHRYDRR